MIREMNSKNLELKRITKTASLLLMSGVSPNSIPFAITERLLKEQNEDEGWISIVDTMWNTKYLQLIDPVIYHREISAGLNFIKSMSNSEGLWGRSKRDVSRIPVTGILFYLFPDIATGEKLCILEALWESEYNSIVYKAGYTMMAYSATGYSPQLVHQIENSCNWLIENQRPDGGFAPWLDHPVDSDVFCTSIATLGLLQYPQFAEKQIFINSYDWLIKNRLKIGIWKYHEIEDGASWGLYALSKLERYLEQ